jgi:hypothetical protein
MPSPQPAPCTWTRTSAPTSASAFRA